MPFPRIFQDQSLTIDDEILLDAQASHHLLNVLRVKPKETLIVFNGRGGEYKATLIAIEKKLACVSLDSFDDVNRESTLAIHLGQVMARGDKMDWIIQKAIELGVNDITPLSSEHCNVRLNPEHLEKKWEHWYKVMLHACEQSGRTCLPDLHPIHPLTDWGQSTFNGCSLVLHPLATESLTDVARDPSAIRLLIGPEGGLSHREIETLQSLDFQACLFGPRILRTETAGMSVIASLQTLYGDC